VGEAAQNCAPAEAAPTSRATHVVAMMTRRRFVFAPPGAIVLDQDSGALVTEAPLEVRGLDFVSRILALENEVSRLRGELEAMKAA
jgi:hypothetical protein